MRNTISNLVVQSLVTIIISSIVSLVVTYYVYTRVLEKQLTETPIGLDTAVAENMSEVDASDDQALAPALDFSPERKALEDRLMVLDNKLYELYVEAYDKYGIEINPATVSKDRVPEDILLQIEQIEAEIHDIEAQLY